MNSVDSSASNHKSPMIGTSARTFDLAIDTVAACDMGRMVSATYPLADYEDAIAHAAAAGRRGAIKIAFDLRTPTKEKH